MGNWRFREVFSLVGALLFFALFGASNLGLLDVKDRAPSGLVGAIPMAFDIFLVMVAIIALTGGILLTWNRIQDQVELPDEDLA